MIRILIVDDHLLIREGLKKIISYEIDMKVIGECQNATEVLDYLNDPEFDVMVLDIHLPGKSGLDLLKELPLRETGISVLVLSIHPEERFALRALQAGASGYLTKDVAGEELVGAIRRIYRGGRYISQAVAEQLAANLQNHGTLSSFDSLSDREFQILRLIGEGRSPNAICKELSLSVSTVKTYRQRLMRKLNLKSTADIIHYAIQHKLVD